MKLNLGLPVCVCCSALWTGFASAQSNPTDGPPPVRATFALIDSGGSRVGQVGASQEADGVVLQIVASHLPPGRHPMHLHAGPACEPPAFTTAGHRLKASGPRPAESSGGVPPDGLPSIDVQARGEGRIQLRIEGVTLTAGPRSIGVPGTALVLDAGDDDTTRIACAGITVATP